ncbi:MAG: transposase [Pseudomonadota bacterium]
MHRIDYAQPDSHDGVHTNKIESFIPRLRRLIGGKDHEVRGQHLVAYAAHVAWPEDHRDKVNGKLAQRLIGSALAAPASRQCSGVQATLRQP